MPVSSDSVRIASPLRWRVSLTRIAITDDSVASSGAGVLSP